MMILRINRVEHGAEFDDMIWDFWINATLPNLKDIELFDYQALNLTPYIGYLINVTVSTLFIQLDSDSSELYEIEGKIIFNNESYILINEEGIKIILKTDEVIDLPINQKKTFYLGRLDLESFEL